MGKPQTRPGKTPWIFLMDKAWTAESSSAFQQASGRQWRRGGQQYSVTMLKLSLPRAGWLDQMRFKGSSSPNHSVVPWSMTSKACVLGQALILHLLSPQPRTDSHPHTEPRLLLCYLAQAGAVKELPLQMHPACISWLLKLISRGQLNYYANPCILSTVSLIWICVYAYWEALISSSFNVSKAPDSFQRIILAVLTSLKCGSWFEKVLTSTICYFSLNNLHFKGNMAFIFEWISVCCQNLSQMSKKKRCWSPIEQKCFHLPKEHQRKSSSF